MDQKSDGNPEVKKSNPAEEGEPAAALPGQDVSPKEVPEEGQEKEYVIDIFRDWCKACGICAAFCPRDCIHLNEAGQPVADRPDRCTGCGWCEIHCPDFAICVRERQEKVAREEAE